MGTLVFQATLGGTVNLIGPNIAGTVNFTLPSADGTSGQALRTNASGVLSFGTLAVTAGGTGVTTSTGSGNTVLSTSPTLVTPTLGVATATSLQGIIGNVTPAAGTFTTITGSNDASVNGLTVGRGAGAVATNTAVGASALNNGSLSGGDNFGAGYNSAQALTTGVRNTILGSQSGQNLTTGSDNILIGYRTVYNATSTGSNNVAVGNQSLYSNTTASNNTAVGYQAGYSTTTGGITAFGYQAGYTNITGLRCVYLGRGAGYGSTGDNNTYVGYGAGNVSTGVNNTFVGGYNSSFGASGGEMTTGSKNTILGTYTGNQDSLDIRTSSNYVVLSDGDGNRQITMKESQTLALDSAVPNSGTGITFPATQSASSDANTLDDYEEGTWTPTLAFGGNSVGITYTTSYNTASYTKIGSRVFVSGITILTSKGSSTGNATLKNLPFPATGVSGFSAVTLSLAGTTFTGQYAAELDANNDEIGFYQVTVLGVQSALTNTNFSNSSAFTFSFSYFT